MQLLAMKKFTLSTVFIVLAVYVTEDLNLS